MHLKKKLYYDCKYLLNKKKYINLSKNILNVIRIFDHFKTCTNSGLKFENLLSELFFILKKYYYLVASCEKTNWYKEAI